MNDALNSATICLNSAWAFISANPILFSMCALGLLGSAIAVVKKLFKS